MAFSLPLAQGHHSPPKPSVSTGTPVGGGAVEDGRDKALEPSASLHDFSVYVGNLPFSVTEKMDSRPLRLV